MENPATWTIVERTIQEAIIEWEKGREEFRCGYSLSRLISLRLEEKNLLSEEGTS